MQRLQVCLVNSFNAVVFFHCCHNMKYSRYVDSFVVENWFDGLFIFLLSRQASHKRSDSY